MKTKKSEGERTVAIKLIFATILKCDCLEYFRRIKDCRLLSYPYIPEVCTDNEGACLHCHARQNKTKNELQKY